jgi:general secretion pathway protein G
MRRQSSRRIRRSGFTLLEVLLVLAILGVIAAIVVPRLLGQQRTANVKAAQASIEGFEKALELYALHHNGRYPEMDSTQVVELLMSPTDENGQPQEVILTEPPNDPWGKPLNYEFPTTKTLDGSPAIWSNGENLEDESGGGDDITNWARQQAAV